MRPSCEVDLKPDAVEIFCLKDEIFILYRDEEHDCYVEAYSVNDPSKMTTKFNLSPGVVSVLACDFSNCLYIGTLRNVENILTYAFDSYIVPYPMVDLDDNIDVESDASYSIWRGAKDVSGAFVASPWINNIESPGLNSRVSLDGYITLLYARLVRIYDSAGTLISCVSLQQNDNRFDVVLNHAGNIIELCHDREKLEMSLIEIDVASNVIASYTFTGTWNRLCCNMDTYGRFILYDRNGLADLLDSQLNPVTHTVIESDNGRFLELCDTQYDPVRNSLICLCECTCEQKYLIIFDLFG